MPDGYRKIAALHRGRTGEGKAFHVVRIQRQRLVDVFGWLTLQGLAIGHRRRIGIIRPQPGFIRRQLHQFGIGSGRFGITLGFHVTARQHQQRRGIGRIVLDLLFQAGHRIVGARHAANVAHPTVRVVRCHRIRRTHCQIDTAAQHDQQNRQHHRQTVEWAGRDRRFGLPGTGNFFQHPAFQFAPALLVQLRREQAIFQIGIQFAQLVAQNLQIGGIALHCIVDRTTAPQRQGNKQDSDDKQRRADQPEQDHDLLSSSSKAAALCAASGVSADSSPAAARRLRNWNTNTPAPINSKANGPSQSNRV